MSASQEQHRREGAAAAGPRLPPNEGNVGERGSFHRRTGSAAGASGRRPSATGHKHAKHRGSEASHSKGSDGKRRRSSEQRSGRSGSADKGRRLSVAQGKIRGWRWLNDPALHPAAAKAKKEYAFFEAAQVCACTLPALLAMPI